MNGFMDSLIGGSKNALPDRRKGGSIDVLMDKAELIVFYKALIKGTIKTRIAETLGENNTLFLYKAMLSDLKNNIKKLEPITHPMVNTGAEKESLFWENSSVQCCGDLGQRMEHAFTDAFTRGKERVLLIGSDIPEINSSLLISLFKMLDRSDLVLGPSFDGGYYCIGFKRETFNPTLFHDIPWSTEEVLNLTMKKAYSENLTTALGPVLQDFDNEEDLKILSKIDSDLMEPVSSANFLKSRKGNSATKYREIPNTVETWKKIVSSGETGYDKILA